ncbi:DNA methyltransferase [Aeromonas salmonicida]|uniref:site-specific DNA-methyltransferase n=1 Tax=Aeromonas salmonicida TaxID=645 RepID=UPI00259E707F|nr:DNA methyltransferase [Aeromonas salmonicida]MDM5070063.1 DNA methyltransferase [Aeromonas salmonicida]
MATGVVENERTGDDAILASSGAGSYQTLPPCDSNIELFYANKIPKAVVLTGDNSKYFSIKNSGHNAVESIPCDSLIFSDNLDALNALRVNYSGKVKLIYTDPPYGTGFDFQSRELDHAYTDKLGAASWVEMMRRRLILIRELMSLDGSLYIHIGHQRLFHLKIIMDEVFGEDNFRNLIVRKKCSSKNSTKRQYPNLHDYILFYTKSADYQYDQPGVDPSDEWIKREYNKVDEYGRYKLVPIHAPGVRNGETGMPWRGVEPPKGKHWRLAPSKLEERDKKGLIHWSKTGNPREKIYLTNDKKLPLTDYWGDFRDAHHQSKLITGYPTEKNIDMLKVIVGASSLPGDIVLDPFCGSGTLLQAAADLDRKFIGIDQSFTAVKHTLKRMRVGLERMGDYVTSESTGNVVKNNIGIELIVDAVVLKENSDSLRELHELGYLS